MDARGYHEVINGNPIPFYLTVIILGVTFELYTFNPLATVPATKKTTEIHNWERMGLLQRNPNSNIAIG